MTNEPLDIEEARRRCGLTMRNTNAGKWLAAALDELEQARADREEWKRRLEAELEALRDELGGIVAEHTKTLDSVNGSVAQLTDMVADIVKQIGRLKQLARHIDTRSPYDKGGK